MNLLTSASPNFEMELFCRRPQLLAPSHQPSNMFAASPALRLCVGIDFRQQFRFRRICRSPNFDDIRRHQQSVPSRVHHLRKNIRLLHIEEWQGISQKKLILAIIGLYRCLKYYKSYISNFPIIFIATNQFSVENELAGSQSIRSRERGLPGHWAQCAAGISMSLKVVYILNFAMSPNVIMMC